MTPSWADSTKQFWWLVHKDLRCEWRAPRVAPTMLLLGAALALVITIQVDLPRADRSAVLGGLFWIAAIFAGSVALDRSIATEREHGCWQALRCYPLPPAAIFLAKCTTNFLALLCLDALLVPAFVAFADVPLLNHPLPLAVVLLLGNLGCAAAGTLISALTSGAPQRGGLLALLLLPLLSPVLLGAAQATRLLTAETLAAEWARWAQLLGAFALLFVALGALLFEFVCED